MLLLTLACTWISQADYDARLAELDDDGDGFARDEGDCNDDVAAINPDATEIWYDGTDQDCAGDDDYDQDGDGFRQANAPDHGGNEPDCNDQNADIYPFAPDTWYDNVDSDCQGNDDFDADSDGVRSKTGGGEDCDDEPLDDADHAGPGAAATYPGADDTWYDGVDADCAGNDDYDQDGDGYVDATYFDGDDAPETLWCPSCGDANKGDCDDDPTDDDESVLPAADVNNGATDSWYDGVDQDCAGDDDFDQDLDGYADDDSLVDGLVPDTAHCDACPLSIPGDCDDTEADFFPDALEDPSSNDDQDCDGDADSVGISETADVGWTLTTPYSLRAAQTSTEVWFSVQAVSSTDHTAVTWSKTATAFSISLANPDLGPQSVSNWQVTTTNDITSGQGFFIDGTDLIGATNTMVGLERTLNVSVKPTGQSTETATATLNTGGAFTGVDVGLTMDNQDKLHAISCQESRGIVYTQVEDNDLGNSVVGIHYTGYNPGACAIETVGTAGHIWYADQNDGGALVHLTFNPTTSTPSFSEVSRDGTLDATDIWLVKRGSEVISITADQGAEIIEISGNDGIETLNLSEGPVSVQAVSDPLDPDWLYITWADENGDAGIAWGDLDSGFEVGVLNADFTVLDTAPQISADGATLFVGLLGDAQVAVETLTPPS